MSDIHALSGAYALDALDDLERRSFARHLAGCASCQAEVDEFRDTAALLAEAAPVNPPAALRAAVLAHAATTRPLPPVVALPHRSGLHARRPRRLTALIAAAAAVVAVGVGGTVAVDQLRGDGPADTPVAAPSAVDQVLQSPDAERFSQQANGGGTITIVRSKALNQAVLQTRGLSDVPSDKTRELWLLHGTQYLPAGYLPSGTDHTMLLDGDPASARGFGITVEEAEGASSPSDDLVALMPFADA